jgi:hypothetical protein
MMLLLFAERDPVSLLYKELIKRASGVRNIKMLADEALEYE